ncbi:DUF4214 domain-containing protein [Vreelandella sp. EE27]
MTQVEQVNGDQGPEEDAAGMESLLQRLRAQSRHDDMRDSLSIKSWVNVWNERLEPVFEALVPRAFTPQRLQLSELLSLHLDDEEFVERAYTFLLGRSPEDEGKRYYLKLVADEGRMVALVTLLQAEEGRLYRRECELELPGLLRRLHRWYWRLKALPFMSEKAVKVWQAAVEKIWARRHRHWKEQGQYYDMLVHQDRWHRQHMALTTTLKEMAEVQRMLLTLESDLPPSSPLAPALQEARGSLQWQNEAQVTTMLEMLQKAQTVLHNASGGLDETTCNR